MYLTHGYKWNISKCWWCGGYLHSYCAQRPAHWPDSAPAWRRRLYKMTNMEPELWLFYRQSVVTGSHWHMLHSISLKGETGANQSWEPASLLPAQAIPGICRLLEVWPLAIPPLLQYCLSAVWHVFGPSPSLHMPQHWQIVTGRSP